MDDSPEKSPEKAGNWIDFYTTTQTDQKSNDSYLSKFLNLKLLDKDNYSTKFLDFMRECLMFDPKDRMKAFDLLSHPVFRKYNKIYISQQIVMTKPITKVEKHHLTKIRRQYKNSLQGLECDPQDQKDMPTNPDLKIKQLLDIIKIKVRYEKRMGFLSFLMSSFNQINQRENDN